jgi:hypothetical protein
MEQKPVPHGENENGTSDDQNKGKPETRGRKRAVGRPTKFSPEIAAKVIAALAAGNFLETAAAHAGVASSVLRDWIRNGERGKTQELADFALAVEKAQADAEVRDVAQIGKAGQKEWTACAWRLERKFPQRWGRRERVDLGNAEDGKPLVVAVKWQD